VGFKNIKIRLLGYDTVWFNSSEPPVAIFCPNDRDTRFLFKVSRPTYIKTTQRRLEGGHILE
jgi:hypothetical protein